MGNTLNLAAGRALNQVEGAFLEFATPVQYWLPREDDEPLEALAERLAALQAWFDKLAAGRPNRVVARTDATYRAGLFASAAIPAGEEYLEVPAVCTSRDESNSLWTSTERWFTYY